MPRVLPFLARRFASFVLTLAAASVVVFAVLDVLPGNVAQVMLGESATPESIAALEKRLGLTLKRWLSKRREGAEPHVGHDHP